MEIFMDASHMQLTSNQISILEHSLFVKGDVMGWQWEWNSLLSVTVHQINLSSFGEGYSTDLFNAWLLMFMAKYLILDVSDLLLVV